MKKRCMKNRKAAADFAGKAKRKPDAGRRREKDERNAEITRHLAQTVDKLLAGAVIEKELDFDAYINALGEISIRADMGEHDTAIELIYVLATILDCNADAIIRHLIYPHPETVVIFTEYFSEYIADKYLLERTIRTAEAEMQAKQARRGAGQDDALRDIYGRKYLENLFDEDCCCIRNMTEESEEESYEIG